MSGLSIIVPNLNGAHLLERHLTDLLNTLEDLPFPSELIITDDNSTDSSELLAQMWASSNSNVLFYKNSSKKRGFSTNCNFGARHARYGTLFFLNNDCEIGCKDISRLYEALWKKPSIFAVTPKILRQPQNIVESLPTIRKVGAKALSIDYKNKSNRSLNLEHPVAWCCGAAFMTKKILFQGFGGFFEAYAPAYFEDVDLCFLAWRSGFSCTYIGDAVALHYANSTTDTALSFRKEIISQRNMLTLERRHSIQLVRGRTSAKRRLQKVVSWVLHKASNVSPIACEASIFEAFASKSIFQNEC
jgi:GT2 family glycosyltransferase